MSSGRWSAGTRFCVVVVGVGAATIGALATLRYQSGTGAAALVLGGLLVGLVGVAGGTITVDGGSSGQTDAAFGPGPATASGLARAQHAGDNEAAYDLLVGLVRAQEPDAATYHQAALAALEDAADRVGIRLRPSLGYPFGPAILATIPVIVDFRAGTGFAIGPLRAAYHELLRGPSGYAAALVMVNAVNEDPAPRAINRIGAALDRPLVAVPWRIGEGTDRIAEVLAGIRQDVEDRGWPVLPAPRRPELAQRAEPVPELAVDADGEYETELLPPLGARHEDDRGELELADRDPSTPPPPPEPAATIPAATQVTGPETPGLEQSRAHPATGARTEVPDAATKRQGAGVTASALTSAVDEGAESGRGTGPESATSATADPDRDPGSESQPSESGADHQPEGSVAAPAEGDVTAKPETVDEPETDLSHAEGTHQPGDPPQGRQEPTAPRPRAPSSVPRPAYDDSAAWQHATDLHWQGHLQDAERAYRTIIEYRVHAVGPEDPDTLAARDQHATVLRDLDRLPEALAEGQDVLTARERILGADDPDTLTSRSHLATIYHQLGDFEKAETEHRRVLDARVRTLGENHQETLISRSNLAKVYQDLGELNRAIEEHQKVMRARADLLGAEHRDTLMSRSLLASALHHAERLEEAEREHRQVLSSRVRLLGASHLDTAVSRHRLASVLHDLGRFDEAAVEYRAAHEVYARLLGGHSPFAQAAASDLALLERERTRPDVGSPNVNR